jgi:hypothetical protein
VKGILVLIKVAEKNAESAALLLFTRHKDIKQKRGEQKEREEQKERCLSDMRALEVTPRSS